MEYSINRDVIIVVITAIVITIAFYQRYIELFIVKYYMMLKYQNDGAFPELYTDYICEKLLKRHSCADLQKIIKKDKGIKSLEQMFLNGVEK